MPRNAQKAVPVKLVQEPKAFAASFKNAPQRVIVPQDGPAPTVAAKRNLCRSIVAMHQTLAQLVRSVKPKMVNAVNVQKNLSAKSIANAHKVNSAITGVAPWAALQCTVAPNPAVQPMPLVTMKMDPQANASAKSALQTKNVANPPVNNKAHNALTLFRAANLMARVQMKWIAAQAFVIRASDAVASPSPNVAHTAIAHKHRAVCRVCVAQRLNLTIVAINPIAPPVRPVSRAMAHPACVLLPNNAQTTATVDNTLANKAAIIA
jgi:hypothetical protein